MTAVGVTISPRTESRSAQQARSEDLQRIGRLDLTGKLFQRSLWPAVTAVARGESLPAPVVVELDPTSFCDMACQECISAELLNQGRFTRERLIDLADEFVEAGVRAVILIGGGNRCSTTAPVS